VTNDVFSIVKGATTRPKHANYRYQTFSPGKVPAYFQAQIDTIIKEYNFYAFPSIVLVPFFNDESTVAIAIIGTTETDRRFFDGLKYVINIFIKQVVTSFENSLLHEEVNEASITDPLTKLFNRRYFHARTKEKFSEAKRMGYPVSLMISDLDSFKQYVDKYGHPKGDVILAEVSRLAAEAVRETDIVCRFGGDEFAYLLPFASSIEARTVAERLKKKVATHQFLQKEAKDAIHLTLSIGIASFPENGDTEEEVLRCADQALFYAKEHGKDKIHIFKQQGAKHESVK
jgi:two-component system, cell cycle response regulator